MGRWGWDGRPGSGELWTSHRDRPRRQGSAPLPFLWRRFRSASRGWRPRPRHPKGRAGAGPGGASADARSFPVRSLSATGHRPRRSGETPQPYPAYLLEYRLQGCLKNFFKHDEFLLSHA